MSDEPDESDRETTFLSITGTNSQELQFLANLSPTISEADSNWSLIGNLALRPALNWAKLYEGDSWLTSMARSPRGFLFAVSMNGELHSNRTGTWAVTDLACPGLNAVWAAPDEEVFAVGLDGTRARITGASIDITSGEGSVERLNAVHGTSSRNVLAVGNKGSVMRFDGASWLELETPTNYNLLAVHCRSETEAYVAGAGGVLMRFNGTDFSHLVSPGELVITGLAWYKDALHLAAGLDGVLRLDPIGGGLDQIKNLIVARLAMADDVLICWGNNLVAEFDGLGWWGGRLDI